MKVRLKVRLKASVKMTQTLNRTTNNCPYKQKLKSKPNTILNYQILSVRLLLQ